MRVSRDAVAAVFDSSYAFTLGEPHRLTEGDDVTVISTGVQSSQSLEAGRLLAQRGVRATLIHVPTLKPLNERAFTDLIGDAPVVVTVEEHSRIAGLGGLVAELLSERGDTRVLRIGLEDRWSESAPNDFLLDKYGLSPERVADSIAEQLASLR